MADDEVRLFVSRTAAGLVRVRAAGPVDFPEVASEGDDLSTAFFNFCGVVGDEIMKPEPNPVAVQLARISAVPIKRKGINDG